MKLIIITAGLSSLTLALSVNAQSYYNAPPSNNLPPQQYSAPPQNYRPLPQNNRPGPQNHQPQQQNYGQRQQYNQGPAGNYPMNNYPPQNYRNMPPRPYQQGSSFPPDFNDVPYMGTNNQNRGPYPWQQMPYWRGGDAGPEPEWFQNRPRDWTSQGPKEGSGQVFDDFLDGPSRFGDMPGGWSAPSIAVPNPIDVAEELKRGSKDVIQINR